MAPLVQGPRWSSAPGPGVGRARGRRRVAVAASRLALVAVLAVCAVTAGCSSLPRSAAPRPASEDAALRFRELGLDQCRDGRHERAAVFFQRALQLHAAVDRRAGVAETLIDLGHVRLALDQPDAAAARFAEALAVCEDLIRPDLTARACGGLGVVALRGDDPAAARSWLERALALVGPDPGAERAVLLHDLGQVAMAAGDTAAAADLLTRALAMHEAADHRAGIATTCYTLAGLRLAGGDADAAFPLAHRALALDRSLDNGRGVAQALDLLARISVQQGDPAQADRYLRRAARAWRAQGQPEAAAAAERRRQDLAVR